MSSVLIFQKDVQENVTRGAVNIKNETKSMCVSRIHNGCVISSLGSSLLLSTSQLRQMI